MKINLALVDDHPFMLTGMKQSLSVFEDLNVTLTSLNGKRLIKALEELDTLPDIAIIDFYLPELDGFAITKLIREKFPSIKVIIYSSSSDQLIVQKAFHCGAYGFILKDDDIKEMYRAIKLVYNNEIYDRNLIEKGKVSTIKRGVGIGTKFNIDADITEREKEVVLYICEGLTYKEIAEKMHLSKRTIESHKESVFEKLGISKINDVIIYASKMGWV